MPGMFASRGGFVEKALPPGPFRIRRRD